MRIAGKLAAAAIVVALAAGAAFWLLSAPDRLDGEEIASFPEGDATRGERVFWAAGCASCHAATGASGEDRLLLPGGLRLATPFGDFVAPNISSHPQDGIGDWSLEDFANAVLRGVSPGGRHYFPAFPYGSYTRMTDADVADLYAFMRTLPPVEGEAPDHTVGFPFNITRGIGLWKRLYLHDGPVVALADATEQVQRGQYLVEALGHCGECHTPRDMLGGPDESRWLAGAAAAEGEGNVPNITPGEDGIGGWSEGDIVTLLETGFTPDYDSVGGSMAAVVRNMAELPDEDREAIGAYLKAIPAHPDGD